MKRSMKLAAATVAAATTIGVAAPAANAATTDQGLYPRTGQIYIDPVTTKVLAATPSGEVAHTAARLVHSTGQMTTTVLVLSSAKYRIDHDIAEAARYPHGSVSIHWEIRDGGETVRHTAIVNKG
jgi:hypothetical protein